METHEMGLHLAAQARKSRLICQRTGINAIFFLRFLRIRNGIASAFGTLSKLGT